MCSSDLHEAGEPGADQDNLHIYVQRRARHERRVRVVEQVGVAARRLQVLLVAVLAQALVALGAVPRAQRLAIGIGEARVHALRLGGGTVGGMIRVSVYYPTTEGATFDHDYYRTTHVPLAQKAWSPVSTTIEKGVNGPHVAAVHMTFASLDAFNAAMGSPLTGDVMADVANYTSIAPVMQISEVVG